MNAPLQASAFPSGSHVPSGPSVTFTLEDLLHALFVTGRAVGHEWSHGSLSLFEWLHRASIVPAYLYRRPGGRVARTALADSLDRSEKVNLSYALGQAGTALFARQELGVHRLLHFDRYAGVHGPIIVGRRSPDLFGTGTSGWVVLESKGRSNPPSWHFPREAKNQATVVRSIAGSAPWIAAGVVTYFDRHNRCMSISAEDPPPDEDGQALDRVDRGLFDYAYYLSAVQAIGEESTVEQVDGRPYRVRRLAGTGLSIGLLEETYELVRSSRNASIDMSLDVAPLGENRSPEVQPDGMLVRVAWVLRDSDVNAVERF